jgi:hypothetical protein
VFRDHLKTVVFGCLQYLYHGRVHDVAHGLTIFSRLSLDKIDACERHGFTPQTSLPRPSVKAFLGRRNR